MKEASSVKVFECQVTVGSSAISTSVSATIRTIASALSTSVSATIRTIASALSTSGRVLNAKSDPVLGESVRPTSSVKTMQPDKSNVRPRFPAFVN